MKRVIACFILIFGFAGNVLLAGVKTEFEKTVERLEKKYVNGDMYSMLVYKYDQHGKLIETNEYYEGKLKETKLYR